MWSEFSLEFDPSENRIALKEVGSSKGERDGVTLTVLAGKTGITDGPATIESTDLVVTGKGFSPAILDNYALSWGNRSYNWREVPSALRGAQYTKTNGGVPAEIRVKAKRDTVVRVMIDVKDPKGKLPGWSSTELHFTTTESGADMRVFEQRIAAGKEIDIPQVSWCGTLVVLPPGPTPTNTVAKAPELEWLIGKTWSTAAGNSLKFSEGGEGVRTTKSGKTPFTWRVLPSGLVEVVLKESTPVTLYVEIKNASEAVFGYSEVNRGTELHAK
jgi:hypothetical protein